MTPKQAMEVAKFFGVSEEEFHNSVGMTFKEYQAIREREPAEEDQQDGDKGE